MAGQNGFRGSFVCGLHPASAPASRLPDVLRVIEKAQMAASDAPRGPMCTRRKNVDKSRADLLTRVGRAVIILVPAKAGTASYIKEVK